LFGEFRGKISVKFRFEFPYILIFQTPDCVSGFDELICPPELAPNLGLPWMIAGKTDSLAHLFEGDIAIYSE
jgi:hypothetical protein